MPHNWKHLDELAEERSTEFTYEDIEGPTFPRPRMTAEEETAFVKRAERCRMYGNSLQHFGYIYKTNHSKQKRTDAKKELRHVYKTIDDDHIRQVAGMELGYSKTRIKTRF